MEVLLPGRAVCVRAAAWCGCRVKVPVGEHVSLQPGRGLRAAMPNA